MELIQTAYRILFNLEFELEGYNLDTNSLVKIIPDDPTSDLLRRYRMLKRGQKSMNTYLIETIPSGIQEEVPKIMLEDDELFLFQVKFKDNRILGSTHLRSYDLVNSVFVLSNAANHIDGGDLLLSVPPQPYNSSNHYLAGYIAASGGNLFKALQESSNADPHPVTETAYWEPLSTGPCLSQADLQDRSTLTYPVDLDTVIVVEVRHSPLLNASYQLLDVDSKCREVSYKSRLLKQN